MINIIRRLGPSFLWVFGDLCFESDHAAESCVGLDPDDRERIIRALQDYVAPYFHVEAPALREEALAGLREAARLDHADSIAVWDSTLPPFIPGAAVGNIFALTHEVLKNRHR